MLARERDPLFDLGALLRLAEARLSQPGNCAPHTNVWNLNL